MMHPLLAASLANTLSATAVRAPPVASRRPSAARSAPAHAAPPTAPVEVVIRRATDGRRARRSSRLGALDSDRRAGELLADAVPPTHDVLVAEVDGTIEAALALDDGLAVADPFRPSALHAAAARPARPPARRRTRRADGRGPLARAAPAHVVTSRAVLPPGPSAPPALQTWEWLARPTTLLRRCAARYGVPFTLRTAWTDAPMVVVSDPADVRAVFTAPADVATRRRELELPRAVRRPELDPHPRRPRAPAPAQADAAAVPRRPHARAPRADRGARGRRGRRAGRTASPFATHARMQALTLDVIMRVVFGAELPELRARDPAHARHDDVAAAGAVLLADRQRPRLPARARRTSKARLTAVIRARRRERPGDAIVDELIAAGSTDDELRDQLVTLLAAGHETTAGCARVGARAARPPPARCSRGCATDEPGYADAVVKEVLRTRPGPDDRRAQARRAVLGRRLGAARGRARRALHLPHAPPRRALPGPDRVPPRALPRRRRARTATRGSRSAAACAAASAPRSPRWR